FYIGGNNVSCLGAEDGSVDLTVSGGTQPYSYIWSNGATTEDLTDVGAGTYDVTVTDANLCSVTGSITLEEPEELIVEVCPDQKLVYGYYPFNVAEIGITDLTGGTPPYTFAWS